MKKLKNFFLFLFVTFMGLGLGSCKDDDDEIGNVGDLYGVWEPIHTEGWEMETGKKQNWDKDVNAASDGSDYNRIAFYEDGTYASWWYQNGWKVDIDRSKGTWQLKGNKITGSNEEYDGETTVVSLSATQLIMEVYEKDDEEDMEFYEKITYKKVS